MTVKSIVFTCAAPLALIQLHAAEAPKVLVFSRCEGFRHEAAVKACCETLAQEAGKGRYKVDFTNEYDALTIDNLLRYKALVLNNTTALKTKDHPKIAPAICSFVRWGGGLCALHAAADNFNDAPEGSYLVGGIFCGHPWLGGGTWAFKVEDRANPVCAAFKGFPDGKFKRSDEIYQQGSPFYDRAKLHVLVSLDMSDPETSSASGQIRTDKDNAVSWIRRYGSGRVFYTSFGHDHRAWKAPDTRAHMLAGLDYTLGLLKADDAPSRPAAATPPPKALAECLGDVLDHPYTGIDGREREARYDALGTVFGRAVESGTAHEAAPFAAKVLARADLPEMVRACAARVLLADDPARLPAILADPSRRVREAAFGRGLKIPAKQFAASLKGVSPELVRALVARLAQDGAKDCAAAVAACAEGADDETAAAVACALGALGGPAQMPVLQKLYARGGSVGVAAEDAMSEMEGIGAMVFDLAAQDVKWLGVAARRSERKLLPRWHAFIAHADAKVRKAAWRSFGKQIDETMFEQASAWFAAVRAEEATVAANTLWRIVKDRGTAKNDTLIALWRKTTPPGREAVAALVNRTNALTAFGVWEKVIAAGGTDAPVAKRIYVELANKVLGNAVVTAAEPKREKWTASASRNPDRAKFAIDGKPETRWDSGWRPKNQWFAIDLGDSFFVVTATLDVEKSPRDTPKGGELYVSQNGTDWDGPVATCDDKTEKKTVFNVGRGARHLKFVATGEDQNLYWSIHEIEVKAGVDRELLAKIQKMADGFRQEVK